MENDLRLIRGNRDSPPINQWDVVTEDMKLDIAQTPEFGLNGYFLGGVWDRWYGDIRKNHPRFVRVEDVDERKVNLVSKSLSLMKHPSRVIGFISNASGEPGRIGTPLDSIPDTGWPHPIVLATRSSGDSMRASILRWPRANRLRSDAMADRP